MHTSKAYFFFRFVRIYTHVSQFFSARNLTRILPVLGTQKRAYLRFFLMCKLTSPVYHKRE